MLRMVERPFADKRVFGPLIDLGIDETSDGKIQLGVPGTVSPGRSKGNLNLLFVLDTHVATLPKDVDGTLEDKIAETLGLNIGFTGSTVSEKRSGPKSTAPFEEQAIIVKVNGDDMPLQDTQIHNAAGSIERHYSDFDVGVKQVIIDTV